MVLDGIALQNLHILPARQRGRGNYASHKSAAAKFSLLNTISHCATAFGKRLLKQWICAPSCDPKVIVGRQRAVLFLMDSKAKKFVGHALEKLRTVPDLERLFQRYSFVTVA